jgi:hypothetical protein
MHSRRSGHETPAVNKPIHNKVGLLSQPAL